MTDHEDPIRVLKTVFGHDSFRGQQEAVVRASLEGRNVVALFPTGLGKTLCYALPAMCLEGLTIVVSPLKALMKDQIEGLRRRNIVAGALNQDTPAEEAARTKRDLKSGRLKLLYVSPERIFAGGFLDLIGDADVVRIAVDEAHLITTWGSSGFREEYERLGELADMFPGVPRMAVTATADEHTRDRIMKILRIQDAVVCVSSFDRPNIAISIVEKEGSGDAQIVSIIRSKPPGQSGIVYRLSRRKTEETAAMLNAAGIRALPYHAGLPTREKTANQDSFLEEPGLTMVATIAFGMGIDKPDVRYVIHGEIPADLSAYVQEAGRAGRDGLPATSHVLYGLQDIVQRRRMIDDKSADKTVKMTESAKLSRLLGFCETALCRRQALLASFGEQHAGACGSCDTCLDPPETFDGTTVARKALSAILRTGQSFGPKHVIDVLRGKRTPQMIQRNHTALPTFGVGADLTEIQWHAVIRQLVVHDHVRVDYEGYGALKMQPSAAALLRGETTVEMRASRRRKEATARVRGRTASSPPPSAVDDEDPLYSALSAERSRLAKEKSVPAYIIVNNAALKAIAERKPKAVDELVGIPGIGDVKRQQYGEALVGVVLRHCA